MLLTDVEVIDSNLHAIDYRIIEAMSWPRRTARRGLDGKLIGIASIRMAEALLNKAQAMAAA